MVRSPCCDIDSSLKKGPWTPEEDQKLVDYISRNGHGSWRALPKLAGLNRCGKSCRLRWTNYLRPDIKRGRFSEEEERVIINLHSVLGNKWSRIASHLPGRTDNEIKNFWNTHIRKKLFQMGIDPVTHKPRTDLNHLLNLSQMIFSSPFLNLMSGSSSTSHWDHINGLKLQTDVTQLAKIQLLQNLLNSFQSFGYNNSGLLGFQNPNPFEPNGLKAHTTVNHGSTLPATSGEPRGQMNSWSWFESGLDMDGLYIQQENELPPLIYASSDETSTISKMEKESSETHHLSTSTDPITTTFEALEKFMNGDETSDSYWKEILDSTWSSSSPVSPLITF